VGRLIVTLLTRHTSRYCWKERVNELIHRALERSTKLYMMLIHSNCSALGHIKLYNT
jgi:hypothetical protein